MRDPADDRGGERKPQRHGRRAIAADSGDSAGRTGPAGERGRDQVANPGGVRGGREAQTERASAGRHSASRAVFSPGYTRAEAESGPQRRPADGQGDPSRAGTSRHGYGSPGPAGGTAGRGPVRGYPPAPGQPPPVYPPGQFAAWNRRRDGQPVPGGQPGGVDGQPTGTGPIGIQQVQPGRSSDGADRYYAEDADVAQPGYSMLAVSDPAADVTSTQTWRAVAEGRSTGIWTAPPGLRDEGTAAAAADGVAAAPNSPLRAAPGRAGTGLPRRPMPDTGPSPRVSSGPNQRVSSGPNARADTGAGPRVSSGSNARADTGQGPRVSTGTNPRVSSGPTARADTGQGPRVSAAPDASADAGAGGPTDRALAGRRRRAGTRTGPRRRRSLSVILALAGAGLLVLAAVVTLVYTVLHDSPKPRLADQPRSRPSATSSPNASPGPYGDIASRQTDAQPLTLAELYPPSFPASGQTVTNVATSLSTDCASEITGATLQSAAGAADCTQVARATYVEPAGIMATIGVLNLITGDAAKTAAQSADANDYISQLKASSGPAQQIGQGTGIEEALAKGHYLILVWAELTDLDSPSTQQSTQIENFITALVQNTANKDLTTRMLTGSP